MIETKRRWNVNTKRVQIFYQRILFDIVFWVLVFSLAKFPLSVNIPIWGTKPIIGYLILTQSISDELQDSFFLTDNQLAYVQDISSSEFQELKKLENSSIFIVANPELTIDEKRLLIKKMKYNQSVYRIIRKSGKRLRINLGFIAYWRFVGWAENRWQKEQILHGSVQRGNGPRTYKIYATRYDAGDRYSVALPDKCLKFTNGGLHVCDDKGYSTKQNYSVYLSYKKHTSALVAESGPWNVDDNYWANYNDPTPRRMFADLALGMPEAQAAYFNGYNGGVDQFGRIVTAPYGIDLARKVSIDIGLKPGKNDWINISYLWTEGWSNQPSGNSTNGNFNTTEESSKEVISPIKLSTPNAEGIIIHTVQAGQSLWNIAAAYEVELAELMVLNNLKKGSLIYPGEELIIKRINTPTQSIVETKKTVMVTKAPTGIMKTKVSEPTTITSSKIVQSTNSIPTVTSTPDNQENKSLITIFNSRNLLIGILFMTTIGIVLLLIGLIYEQKNQ